MVAELERAESHVHIAGWYFSPDFALTREGEPAKLDGRRTAPRAAAPAPRARAGAGERELAILRGAWRRVRAEQRCELVTVVGDARSRTCAETALNRFSLLVTHLVVKT
jgi:hypothetical protein